METDALPSSTAARPAQDKQPRATWPDGSRTRAIIPKQLRQMD